MLDHWSTLDTFSPLHIVLIPSWWILNRFIYVNVGPQGDHPNRTDDTATAHEVVRVFIHEQYRSDLRGFDIALLRLQNPVNGTVAIALPPSIDFNITNNASVVILDFVYIFENGKWQKTALRENTIQVLQSCGVYGYFQSSLQICAGPPKATVDVCPRESSRSKCLRDIWVWITSVFFSQATQEARFSINQTMVVNGFWPVFHLMRFYVGNPTVQMYTHVSQLISCGVE